MSEPWKVEGYDYQVEHYFSDTALDWCLQEIGTGSFMVCERANDETFWLFKSKTDAMMFKLRWVG